MLAESLGTQYLSSNDFDFELRELCNAEREKAQPPSQKSHRLSQEAAQCYLEGSVVSLYFAD